MPWYGVFLLPFAFLFRFITDVRNYLFDLEMIKSCQSPIKTLVVGNLSVGGTGKTPMVEFLIRHLGESTLLGSLSRGYGRKSKGFLQAKPDSLSAEIGDEPLQIYRKFGGNIPVFVGEDRVNALQKIAKISDEIDLMILDDAFQHRKLKPDFSIILTPFSNPFFTDFVLPLGRLRERRENVKRADVVIVTKCPESFAKVEKGYYVAQIRKYALKNIPIFFSNIGYGSPDFISGNESKFSKKVIVIAGLADNTLFLDYCKKHFEVVEVLSFADHFDYGFKEASQILVLWKKHREQSAVLLTTEKDAVKLKFLADQGKLEEIPIFALPIQAKFETNEQEMLLRIIREKLIEK
jgi:tetraacyldisaccharide 4'-kinase